MTERSKGRHEATSSITVGSYGSVAVSIDDDETHHISGEVDFEVSGADGDRPHTYALLEQLEDAVIETIEDFDGVDEGGDGSA